MTTETESGVDVLTEDECWHLLDGVDLGRVGVVLGDGVDIFPVNFLVRDRVVYFASAPGSKLVDITTNPRVAFEADGTAGRRRWSVVLKGEAARLAFDSEIEESGVRHLHSLSPTEKWNYVRISPTSISGRRFMSRRRSG